MLFTAFAYLVAFYIYFIFYEEQDKPNFVLVRKAFTSSILLALQFALVAFVMIAVLRTGYSGFAPIYVVLACIGVAAVSVSGFLYFLTRKIPAWCQWETWWK